MKSYLLYESDSNLSEKRDLRLHLDDDGSLTMDGWDCGPAVELIWGDLDYEYAITLKRRDRIYLLMVILFTWLYHNEA